MRIDFPDLTFAAYRYNGFDRRIEKDVNGTVTRYLYDDLEILLEYDGTNWTVNTDDVCSSVLTTDLSLTQSPPGLSSAAIADNPFSSGDPGLSFTAPGTGNTGYVDIEADLSSASLGSLLGDWDGDSSYDDNPTGRATFGIYKGHDAIIYIRELY